MEIESTIIRYLDGSASYDEKRILLDWLRESEVHRGDFMQTRDLWLSSNAVYGSELEVDLALERFKTKLQELNRPSFRKSERRPGRWRSIAAVAALFLLVAGTTWVLFGDSSLFVKQTTILVTAPNSKGHFMLPDGSEVWLNKESKLTFSQNDFTHRRNVKLDGEAYFEVKKNPVHPFVVEMNELNIEVLGTTFNATHYRQDSCIEVTLNEGAVKLFGEELKESIKLHPGNRFVYNKQTKGSLLDQINPYYYSIWKEEQLEFDNRPLSEIIPCLETWYRVKIDCSSQLATNTRLTFTVKNENPEELMRSISYIAPINYQINENTIVIIEKNKP